MTIDTVTEVVIDTNQHLEVTITPTGPAPDPRVAAFGETNHHQTSAITIRMVVAEVEGDQVRLSATAANAMTFVEE